MFSEPHTMHNREHRNKMNDLHYQFWGASAGRLNGASPLTIRPLCQGSVASSPEYGMSLLAYADDSVKARTSPTDYYPRKQNVFMNSSLSDPFFSSDESSHVANLTVSRTGHDDTMDNVSILAARKATLARCTLPEWCVDDEYNVTVSVTEILSRDGLLKTFAHDKVGCHFLQSNYPAIGSKDRDRISGALLARDGELFKELCSDVFGNFFIQKVIEESDDVKEQIFIRDLLKRDVFNLCLDRYSCRVIQRAIEILPTELSLALLMELEGTDIVRLATDQNANHVIQKVMHAFPVNCWAFVIKKILYHDGYLFTVAENKYGCRVLQLCIEQLSMARNARRTLAHSLLKRLMDSIVLHCDRLAANEYANYIVQHILVTGPDEYRNAIIESSLISNLLSMSQEKCASHVVEKAIAHAPFHVLRDMMDEIFDGYVPHPETHKDALDIMIFHQYGNYVVQRMLDVCIDGVIAKRPLHEVEVYRSWLTRLHERISRNKDRLHRYSSGKKMLTTLDKIPDVQHERKQVSPLSFAVPSYP